MGHQNKDNQPISFGDAYDPDDLRLEIDAETEMGVTARDKLSYLGIVMWAIGSLGTGSLAAATLLATIEIP